MPVDHINTSRSPRFRAVQAAFPWVGLVIVKLWIVGGQRLTAYGSLTIDDEWFVERAFWISTGRWLGPFDYRTLIKQPGYPLFIAGVHWLHLPLLVAQQLLYALAVALLIVAMRPVLCTRRRQLAAFVVLLFNPMTMHTGISARVDRAGVYPALLILLLSCLVGLVRTSGRPTRVTVVWAMGASAALGAVWLLREEWLLVLPAVIVGLGVALLRILGSTMLLRSRLFAAVGIALVPMSVALGTVWLQHNNEANYGLAVTNIEQTSMSAGLGSMFRVAPATTFAQFPITVETRQLLYAASAHFAALRAQIEQRTDARYFSIRPDGVRDLGGQVFQWVVLDAIGASGEARTARQLDDTFRAIGREIDAACSDGRLECSGPNSGIAPAWKWDRLASLTTRTLSGLVRTVDLSAFTALSSPGDGTADDRAIFEQMTHEPLAPGPNDFLTRQRVHIISALRWIYRLMMIVASGFAILRVVATVRYRRRPSWTMASTIGIGLVLLIGRTAGLAYLDLTAFPAFAPTYLAAGYAVALAVAVAFMAGEGTRARVEDMTEAPIANEPSPSQ
jgi:hypothetical protein